jgi:hypothetical protein
MEDFFTNPSVEELGLAHIEKVRGLEEAEAQRLLKSYKQVRQELRDRLDTLPPGKFTSQQIRGTLYQVEAAIEQMNNILSGGMKSSGEILAGQGLEHLATEIRKWDKEFTGATTPINFDAVRIASDTSNFLFNRYEPSLQAYGEGLRSLFASELTNAAIAELSTGQVVQRLGQVFMGEQWKLERLVRTEFHGLYNTGKIRGMEELVNTDMPDLKKTLFHPMDNRTGKDSIKLNRNNPIVNVDEEFVENSTGKVRRYMAPPNRPNDRAILIPYRPGWKS